MKIRHGKDTKSTKADNPIQRILEEFALWQCEIMTDIPGAALRRIARRLAKEYVENGHLRR